MKRWITLLASLVVIWTSQTSTVPCLWAGEGDDCISRTESWIREDIIDQVNRQRERVGLQPLACDGALSAIAQAHAEDMQRHDYFSHTSPDGVGLVDRLRMSGVTYRFAAENIAWGLRDGNSVVKLWMGSSGHRANILGDFRIVGVGAYDGYYVLDFVK